MITVLAGGAGAARFLRGLARVVDEAAVTVVSNTGDDIHVYGAHVSPDLDIVTYTLAGIVDGERGWGIDGDTFRVLDGLRALGVDTWFTLGDADFATCLARAAHLREGGTASAFAARLAGTRGVRARLLPMTDDPVATIVTAKSGEAMHFQEYWVRRRAADPVAAVALSGAADARPAPGVLEAIEAADAVLIAPSNPIVSIGTILAVPGIREALRSTTAPVVGVSPIVGGAVVRGMADKLMSGLGHEVSCTAVAALYEDLIDGFVIDLVDGAAAPRVAEAGGCVAEVAQTMMRTVEDAAALAKTTLALAERIR
ncbi:MAG TPA: 2-phospho-L-lactate transferase [Actinomycetota bacterium]|nr:2-phospho-L-lactate transferase [Actinomycetota bacterium]